ARRRRRAGRAHRDRGTGAGRCRERDGRRRRRRLNRNTGQARTDPGSWRGERTTMADFLGMMKQAAQRQAKMKALQDELDTIEVEGTSGAGLVTVRMTAKMEVKGVSIDPSLMKADEREILE